MQKLKTVESKKIVCKDLNTQKTETAKQIKVQWPGDLFLFAFCFLLFYINLYSCMQNYARFQYTYVETWI